MSPGGAAVSMALVGAQLALQAPVNRRLARVTGAINAAFLSYVGGAALLGVACVAAGELDGIGRIGPHWWHGFSGFLGAFYVVAALVFVRSIGASGIAAATVTGQLTTSVLIDTAGWFGVDQRPLEIRVVLGAAAVLLGTYLVAGLSRRRGAGGGEQSPLLALAVVVIGGALIGIQNPLNSQIAESTGDLSSALLTFLSGGLLIGVAVLATDSVRRLTAVSEARPRYLTGGLFGAIAALASLTLIGEFGAGSVVAAGITGQMLSSLAIDRVGLFGLQPRRVGGRRVLGATLLIVGTALVAR